MRALVDRAGSPYYSQCVMGTTLDQDKVSDRVRGLIARTRDTCLWFYGRNYLPSGRRQTIRTLELIERHGDRDAYTEARKLREWLSRNSNSGSLR
jgi:hypothetical protein